MKVLLRLYPADWRERYGGELEALLEQHPTTPRDAVDLIRGAVDARLRSRRYTNERETDGSPMMTPTYGRGLDWIPALTAMLIVFFAPRNTAGLGLIILVLLCLTALGMWVRQCRVESASAGANETGVESLGGPTGAGWASGRLLVLGVLLLLLWVVLLQAGLFNVEDSFVWLVVSLNLPFGLAVLALIQFWCKARRAGYTSPTGEIALLFIGFAYLVVLLTSALLVSPMPGGSLVFAGVALLGLSLLFQGIALLQTGMLPVWATLAFAAAPLLGGPLSIMPGSTTSQILSFLGLPPYPELGNLALAITWLMLGSALILLPPSRPRARVPLP